MQHVHNTVHGKTRMNSWMNKMNRMNICILTSFVIIYLVIIYLCRSIGLLVQPLLEVVHHCLQVIMFSAL